MQIADPHELGWSGNEAALHPSTVDLDDDRHLAEGKSRAVEANPDDQPRRERRLNKAKLETDDVRDRVARIRLELRELRVELQQRGAKIWEMQGQFWGVLLRQAKSDARSHQPLDELQEQILQSLDEIGPKQAAYDEKEDDLIFFEYQLEKKETRLYDLESRRGRSSPSALRDPSSSTSSQQSRSSSPQLAKDESSLSHRYLSRVGDANIVTERLMELAEEKAHYLYLAQDRDAMGLDLYPPNVDFLAKFDDLYADNLNQLREISEDIQNLELDGGFSSLDSAKKVSNGGAYSPQRKAPSRTQSEPQVGLVHDRRLRRMSDGGLAHVSDDSWTQRRSISRWILESFDVSMPEEGIRHLAILDKPDLNDGDWWRLVLEYWQKGRAAGHLPSSSDALSKLPPPAASPFLRAQKSERIVHAEAKEAEIFSLYPIDRNDPHAKSAPNLSQKSRAINYFDLPLALSSSFDEDVLSFHHDADQSTKL